jgi:hypothetical protein
VYLAFLRRGGNGPPKEGIGGAWQQMMMAEEEVIVNALAVQAPDNESAG